MKKHLSVYVFTLLLKNYVNMKYFFGEKSKNRDKLIESGTPGQHTKNRDSSNVWYFLYTYICIINDTLKLHNCKAMFYKEVNLVYLIYQTLQKPKACNEVKHHVAILQVFDYFLSIITVC